LLHNRFLTITTAKVLTLYAKISLAVYGSYWSGWPETTMTWLLLSAAQPVQGLGAAANRRLPGPMGSHGPAARATGRVIALNAVQGASLVYQ
jgi:hypothetical protein